MTSNHRPTLESKRGKVLDIRDSIAHSRALPSQTKLKTRKDGGKNVDYYAAARSLRAENTVKSKLETSEEPKLVRGGSEDILSKTEELSASTERNDDDDESDKRHQISTHEDEKNESNDKSTGESEDGSGDSDESDDDETEQLMAELAKIKQEREEEKLRRQKEEQEKKDSTMQKNPLLNSFKVSKSWRSAKKFNNSKQPQRSEDETFTSNTVDSELHQSFLNKYIR
ncbi:Pre-mRNA-splicing factor CWC15 [Meyerozyma sp. JA9]|nr:Pre-mRNA-splicing factor CWC15 [Meyerozyma sp. JA9]